jgi:XTP/dITP diphosphohydrolase
MVMATMAKLVLATHNRDKVKEIAACLEGLSLELVSLDAFPSIGPVDEDGETLEDNALKKAREVFRQTGLPSVADDTGLEVYYLNNEPGVFSSRYAGLTASYADNCRKLAERMRGVPARRRGAQFRCVIAFVAQGGFERCVEGVCRGVIIEAPKGTGGFGYDPLFLPDEHTRTFAELGIEEKNKISHRGRALQAVKPVLREYFQSRS